MDRRLWRATSLAVLLGTASGMGGCATSPREYWESLKGDGFPGWSESMSADTRAQAAKPSGFFTDRRSEQIEQRLGGGF